MKGIYRLKLLIILLLMVCSFVSIVTPVSADTDEGSIAVTGSFSSYQYKIVQGETIDTPLINIIFINKYAHKVNLEIYQDAPEGITIDLPPEIITIDAYSRIDLPVVISAAEDALPGEYDIYIRAKLIQETEKDGITVGSEFALKTKLTVFGEAADLEFDVVDVAGKPIRAIMNLYQVENGTMTPMTYSDTGMLTERVIPGTYDILAFWDNYQLVRHTFSVTADQFYQKTLIAETVQIYAFSATPVLVENTDDQLATADIRFVLHNIYEDLEDCRVVMLVYKNDKLIEERDIFLFQTLEVKRHSLGFNYVPAQGWEQAEYKFMLEFYVDEKDENDNVINSLLYAKSNESILDVSSGISFKNIAGFFNLSLILYVLFAGLLAGIFFLIKSLLKKSPTASQPAPATPPKIIPGKECPDCHGEEKVTCPVCEGKGHTMYGSIKEECLYCSGVGEVMCAACVNPSHLIECPKCGGEGSIIETGGSKDCTYCNGLGNIVSRKYAKYSGGVRMKLGKKQKD